MIKLCNINDCTGCGACYNVCPKGAISMKKNEEGFLFPEIDSLKCVECHLCEHSCPVLSPVKKNTKADSPLAVVAKSKEILTCSSSGGMFSLLSSWIISNGGVVFGAVLGKNYEIYHTKATNFEELDAQRGSKYAQSNIGFTYKEVKSSLKEDKYVLYTGTPCQIAGLYGFLGKLDVSKLFTVDLVCHGVPSVASFQLYLQKLAEKEGISVQDIEYYHFRNLKGWGYVPSFKIAGRDTVENQPVSENLYMKLFLGSLLHRKCCYNCKYTTPERVGDITIADFWGIGDERPFPYDTKNGCSLVLLNSHKGRTLFSNISSTINYDIRSWDEALKQNHQLRMSSRCPRGRDNVYSYFMSHTYDETFQHYFNNNIIRLKRFIRKIL